jgi:hypothetical protein
VPCGWLYCLTDYPFTHSIGRVYNSFSRGSDFSGDTLHTAVDSRRRADYE